MGKKKDSMKRVILICILLLASVGWSQVQLDSVARMKVVREILGSDSVLSVQQIIELRRALNNYDMVEPDEVKDSDSSHVDIGQGLTENGSTLPEALISKNKIHPSIIMLEVLGLNVFVWAWDYYVLQKDYADIDMDIWKRNLREGWKWDHNHWAINFYGHPYQGSMYYNAARSGGYGFYRSLLWTALGSFTWEMFAETEYPAPNDLITTTIAGSMYGEVLYRLSRLIYNTKEVEWYKQLPAFAFGSVGYLQRKAFGNRDHLTGFVPIELSLAIGNGSRFGSDYRFGSKSADELDKEWNDHYGFLAGHLEYGRPYTIVKQPFDYFSVDAMWEAGFEGAVLQLDIMGKLKNTGVHGSGHWLDFSINLDYDSFYGDLATVSTISLGGALDLALWITPNIFFRVMNQAYWIILGTADMGYDDLIKEVHPEYVNNMNNYQYNTGAKYSLLLELKYKNKVNLSNKTVVDAMRTIPNSLPHYGASGWDFLLLNNTLLEYSFKPWLQVGGRLDTYIKFAAYSSDLFEPMSHRLFHYGMYCKFSLGVK